MPNTWIYYSAQGKAAFEFYCYHYNSTPPLGYEVFKHWVRIYKGLFNEEILNCIMVISQDFLGKGLTKVSISGKF